MVLSLPDVAALAAQCAPAVAAETLVSIAVVESGFDPLAIGVNGPKPIRLTPRSPADAAGQAQALIAAGRSVDLGLAQINSANLARLGLSVTDAFEPCRNLAAAARLLVEDFGRSAAGTPDIQAALRMTLSRYNTGDPHRGFTNGYVARVGRAAAQIVPALQVAPLGEAPGLPAEPAARAAPAAAIAAWDVFGRAPPTRFVLRLSTSGTGDAP